METCSKKNWHVGADRHRTRRVPIQGPGYEDGNEYSISIYWFSGGMNMIMNRFYWKGRIGIQFLLELPALFAK